MEDLFDRAANMIDVYSGLQALVKADRPSHIHTWCYAHVLNLVIRDASVALKATSQSSFAWKNVRKK